MFVDMPTFCTRHSGGDLILCSRYWLFVVVLFWRCFVAALVSSCWFLFCLFDAQNDFNDSNKTQENIITWRNDEVLDVLLTVTRNTVRAADGRTDGQVDGEMDGRAHLTHKRTSKQADQNGGMTRRTARQTCIHHYPKTHTQTHLVHS